MLRHDAGVGAVLLGAIDSFVQAALLGQLPSQVAKFICAAKLIPLKKPGAKMAIRPIAVGETLRRSVGKVAMASEVLQDAVKNLVPSQVGVTVEGACKTVPMALQRLVEARVGG